MPMPFPFADSIANLGAEGYDADHKIRIGAASEILTPEGLSRTCFGQECRSGGTAAGAGSRRRAGRTTVLPWKVEGQRRQGRKKDPMSTPIQMIPAAEALLLRSLVSPTEQGIASRVLAKSSGGNITLFAFDAGQGLTEHTSPFDALVMVLEGSLTLTIGGTPVRATPGTIVRMPADVSHALDAPEPARMLLIMLRDPKAA